jgi:hypothetical protein
MTAASYRRSGPRLIIGSAAESGGFGRSGPRLIIGSAAESGGFGGFGPGLIIGGDSEIRTRVDNREYGRGDSDQG